MLIDNDENRENSSVENSLMKKVKIKNQFEGEHKKSKEIKKKTYAHPVNERMGEYYEEEPFKIHAKEKR